MLDLFVISLTMSLVNRDQLLAFTRDPRVLFGSAVILTILPLSVWIAVLLWDAHATGNARTTPLAHASKSAQIRRSGCCRLLRWLIAVLADLTITRSAAPRSPSISLTADGIVPGRTPCVTRGGSRSGAGISMTDDLRTIKIPAVLKRYEGCAREDTQFWMSRPKPHWRVFPAWMRWLAGTTSG